MERKRLLVVAVLLLTVGFATITTALVINGTASISTDNVFKDDVLFTAATVTDDATTPAADVGSATISADKKTIDFVTGKLSKIDMESTLNFTITNFNVQYGADVAITCEPYIDGTDEERAANATKFNEFVEMTYDFDGSVKSAAIAPSSTLTGSVTAKAKKTYFDEAGLNIGIKCTISGTATEQTSTAAALPRS